MLRKNENKHQFTLLNVCILKEVFNWILCQNNGRIMSDFSKFIKQSILYVFIIKISRWKSLDRMLHYVISINVIILSRWVYFKLCHISIVGQDLFTSFCLYACCPHYLRMGILTKSPILPCPMGQELGQMGHHWNFWHVLPKCKNCMEKKPRAIKVFDFRKH